MPFYDFQNLIFEQNSLLKNPSEGNIVSLDRIRFHPRTMPLEPILAFKYFINNQLKYAVDVDIVSVRRHSFSE